MYANKRVYSYIYKVEILEKDGNMCYSLAKNLILYRPADSNLDRQ